jgi:hypothetical protein
MKEHTTAELRERKELTDAIHVNLNAIEKYDAPTADDLEQATTFLGTLEAIEKHDTNFEEELEQSRELLANLQAIEKAR